MPTSTASLPAVACAGASGALGFGLAVRLARVGVPVVIGSRSAERAEETVARARELVSDGDLQGLVNEQAAARGDLVVLSGPFASQAEMLKRIREKLRPSQVVVDTSVPLALAVGGKPTRTLWRVAGLGGPAGGRACARRDRRGLGAAHGGGLAAGRARPRTRPRCPVVRRSLPDKQAVAAVLELIPACAAWIVVAWSSRGPPTSSRR